MSTIIQVKDCKNPLHNGYSSHDQCITCRIARANKIEVKAMILVEYLRSAYPQTTFTAAEDLARALEAP